MSDASLSWRDESVPRIAAGVTSQSASDAVVVLRLESGRYFSLDGAGRLIWQLCDGEHTVAEIVDTVSAAYGTDRATVRADTIELLDDLSAEGLVHDTR